MQLRPLLAPYGAPLLPIEANQPSSTEQEALLETPGKLYSSSAAHMSSAGALPLAAPQQSTSRSLSDSSDEKGVDPHPSYDATKPTPPELLNGPYDGLPHETAQDLDAFPAKGKNHREVREGALWKQLLWEGGSPSDVFLTTASAQVGQVLLNLPNSMAEIGITGGILAMVACATAATYTLWLLQSLYQEAKRTQIKKGEWFKPGTAERKEVTQYHDVILQTTGWSWLAHFIRVVNVIELLGLACAQIISSASNLYYAQPTDADGYKQMSKRDFAFLSGAIATTFVFVPSFRHARIFVILALFGSTYVAFYMVAESSIHGFEDAAAAAAFQPTKIKDIFSAVSNILFTFGGHAMLMEVLDSQFRPSKFRKTFAWSLLFVTAILTIPSSTITYLAYPAETYDNGNAFHIFPRNNAMVFGVSVMFIHQMIVYCLFMMPVFHITEKALNVHTSGYFMKVGARLIPALFIWFIALLAPFFGIINDLIGSFCVPFETYIVPCLAFSVYYWSKTRQQQAVDSYHGVPYWVLHSINALIIIAAAVCGLGFGGYASVTEIQTSFRTFGTFANCFGC